MEQKQEKTRPLQYRTLGKTICICSLIFFFVDCYLFASHLLNKDFMVGVIVVTVIAIMTGLSVSGKTNR